MKVFFDTSALIPVFLEDHIHHERSLVAFLAAGKGQAFCSAHSLAELYATCTRLPGKHRLSGEQVLRFLESIDEHLATVTLDNSEYVSVIHHSAGLGIVGGAIYDALIASCAIKAKAGVLYTWNLQDFRRLGPDIEAIVRTP